MPMIIKGIEDYLYENKRDVFYLKLTSQEEIESDNPGGSMRWRGDYRSSEVKANMKMATDWFDRHAVSWAKTGPSDLFEGWVGHLYVDFSGWDDPKLKAWCDEFEIDNTHPKYPEKFTMYVTRYEDWVNSGQLIAYEERLEKMNDPDWSP